MRMQPVFGFIENHGLGAVDDIFGDLQTTVGRQAVHEDRVRRGARHHGLVDAVGREEYFSVLDVVIAHGDPGVGDDAVGATRGFAGIVRGRAYGIFSAVVLAVSLPGLLVLHTRLPPLLGGAAPIASAVFLALMLATGVHLVSLVRAELRPAWFRVLVSIPGQVFLAAGALAGPWLLLLLPLRAVGSWLEWYTSLVALSWFEATPLFVAGLSVVTSSRPAWRSMRTRVTCCTTPSMRPSCEKSRSISISSSRLNICMTVATGT